jgi:hypothetical protein
MEQKLNLYSDKATGWVTEEPWFDSQQEKSWGAHPASCSVGTRVCMSRSKVAGV